VAAGGAFLRVVAALVLLFSCFEIGGPSQAIETAFELETEFDDPDPEPNGEDEIAHCDRVAGDGWRWGSGSSLASTSDVSPASAETTQVFRPPIG